MFHVRLSDRGMCQVGLYLVGNEIAREGEGLGLADVCSFAVLKVRSARGSAAVGKSEILHSLVQNFSTGSMF